MMKRMQKGFFAIAALLSAVNVVADSTCAASPYFSIRPQGVNAARDMVGWEELINLCDMDKFYGAFSITGEYSQSFRSNQLARCLFGNDLTTSTSTISTLGTGCNTGCNTTCNNTLTISGSRAATRGANDWLADYFGLPTDFTSTISFKPRIQNFVADISFYLGLSEWADGLYFRLGLPITWTKWNLKFCENVTNAGSCAYQPGYFDDAVLGVPFDNLLTNATSFFNGSAVPTLSDTVTFDALSCSKWATNGCDCKGLTKTRLADVLGVLGWNFVCCDDYHFGLNIRALAPSGNKPCGQYLFEPIVGNGGHWELGGGISSHAVLWRGCDSDSTFSVYLDANITHLFKSCQTRSFDLCGRPNSRYMLAQKMTSTITNGLSGNATEGVVEDSTASNFQFANEFAPVANLTCSKVKVSYAVQGDVAVKFAYANGCGFTWDIGYEFWGRSHEKICFTNSCTPSALDGLTWALKGDSHVYGFGEDSAVTPVALGATQSLATIHAGLNDFAAGCDQGTANAAAILNPGIDNPEFAVSSTLAVTISGTPAGADQTRTSIQPVLLTEANVDLKGTKGISNKIFTHFGYSWTSCEDWTPFIGVGASAEFGQGCRSNCDTNCSTTSTTVTTASTTCASSCSSSGCDSSSSCNYNSCALSQWAVWVKGGIAFN